MAPHRVLLEPSSRSQVALAAALCVATVTRTAGNGFDYFEPECGSGWLPSCAGECDSDTAWYAPGVRPCALMIVFPSAALARAAPSGMHEVGMPMPPRHTA